MDFPSIFEMDMAESSTWDDMTYELLYTIEKMVSGLPNHSGSCCIYRVPKLLRGLNPEAHTPMAVPIGPIHHKVHGQDSSQVDDPDLLKNRLDKLQYLRSFLLKSKNTIVKFYLGTVHVRRSEIRESYAYFQKIFMENDEIFMEMVLLDSIFIVQLFREHHHLWVGEKTILMAPLELKEIASDLMLAENQLPLFILEDLYYQALGNYSISFIEIACEFLKIDKSNFDKAYPSDLGYPVHLLDMLRLSLLPPLPQQSDSGQPSPESHGHDVCGIHLPPLQQPADDNLITRRKSYDGHDIDLEQIMCPTATGLYEAGIKFEVKEKAFSILDISFNVKKGILYIPKLRVDDGTERQFRNLIAFEQSHIKDYTYITDYQFFLDCLINTDMDVQLLTRAGIIENWLGSEKNVCELINSMGIHAYRFRGGYLYSCIAEELNNYHKKKWYRYKAILKQVYFSHPWAIIPVCYAVVLLLLTIMQVVVGILAVPVLNKPSNN